MSEAFVIPGPEFRHHGDGGPDRPVFVVTVGQGHAEDGHDGVADELVEHSALSRNTLHHDGEVLVQQRDGPLGTQFLGERRKTRDIREEERGDLALSTEDLFG